MLESTGFSFLFCVQSATPTSVDLKLKMTFNRAIRVLVVLFGTVTLVLAKEGTYRIKATSR